MAFENGYNMFDYCGELFERYREDNMVFYKGLQILSYFQSRSDYPYCVQELSEVFERIFGQGIDTMTDFLWKYTTQYENEMKWDARNILEQDVYKDGNMISDLTTEEGNKLVKKFKDEMQTFFITTTPFFEDLYEGNGENISGIDKVAVKRTYGDTHVIRFIRKDGQKLDVSLNNNALKNIIRVLKGIK